MNRLFSLIHSGRNFIHTQVSLSLNRFGNNFAISVGVSTQSALKLNILKIKKQTYFKWIDFQNDELNFILFWYFSVHFQDDREKSLLEMEQEEYRQACERVEMKKHQNNSRMYSILHAMTKSFMNWSPNWCQCSIFSSAAVDGQSCTSSGSGWKSWHDDAFNWRKYDWDPIDNGPIRCMREWKQPHHWRIQATMRTAGMWFIAA